MSPAQISLLEKARHQLEHGRASRGSIRDIIWCAQMIKSVLLEEPTYHDSDFDPCPKGDPDCETGDDGSCHDACERPASPPVE